MATQAEIQGLINQIVTNSNYKANQLRPLLSTMLDFASAGQTLVFDGLVANDTTMADTTLVLEYGVNIIVTATLTDYACKLPIPVTGKRVIVVNRSSMPVTLFPSMAGGQINNYPIDGPATIPPDGNAYDFICIENPLPGAWIWSPPATAQIDSGEIVVSHTTGSPTNATGYSTATLTYAGVGAGVSGGNLTLSGNFTNILFPATIVRVKCYTNIESTDVGSFIPEGISVQLITAFLDSPSSSNLSTQFNQPLYGIPQFPPPDVLFAPIGTLNSPAEIGDTETMYTIFDYVFDGITDQIGTGGPFSSYFYTFGMIIPATAATKTYKFRFFIEYN
jgi:hypothetical protein